MWKLRGKCLFNRQNYAYEYWYWSNGILTGIGYYEINKSTSNEKGDITVTENNKVHPEGHNKNKIEGTLADELNGADALIGFAIANIVTREMIETMNEDAIVFALSNPIPEIMPEEAFKGGARIWWIKTNQLIALNWLLEMVYLNITLPVQVDSMNWKGDRELRYYVQKESIRRMIIHC